MMSSRVQLVGFPPSTFYQTAALTLAEKGVTFESRSPRLADAGHTALHPWRKIPVLVHDDMTVFETLAIATYIDATFAGPKLIPDEVHQQTKMFQWISIYLDYGVSSILQLSVRERFQKMLRKQPPDKEIIARNRPAMDHFCQQLDIALETDFIAGVEISIADLFIIPAMLYFENTPEGRDALAGCSKIASWLSRVKDRRSVMTNCAQIGWIVDD